MPKFNAHGQLFLPLQAGRHGSQSPVRCPVCETYFPPDESRQKYCSKPCYRGRAAVHERAGLKTCTGCARTLALSEFRPVEGKPGPRCYACLRDKARRDRANAERKGVRVPGPDEARVCNRCGEEKPLADFIAVKDKPRWRRTCKNCRYAEAAAYRQRDREAAFAHYGDCCAWCGLADKSKLHVDHIHEDGNHHRRLDPGAYYIGRWLRLNGYPPGFQILCNHCNRLKHNQQAGNIPEVGSPRWRRTVLAFVLRMGGAEAVIDELRRTMGERSGD